jgi:hypothetical protein
MIISPNFGAIGAPQLGQFSAFASVGATTGSAGAAAFFSAAMFVPHFMQNTASSGSSAPHFGQYVEQHLLVVAVQSQYDP